MRAPIAAIAFFLLAGCDAPSGALPSPPGAPRRIVSLAPSLTEILFAVGAGDRVAAVTSHCDYPPEAAARPKVGGYDTPNIELVLAQRPDLVVAPEEGALGPPVERLRALGVRVATISVASLEDLFAACEKVGALAGREAAGRDLAAALRARVAAVERAVAGRPRPRVLFIVDHDPTVAAGRGTFPNALIEAAGASNVVAAAYSAYPRLSDEAILALAPKVVIESSMAPFRGAPPFRARTIVLPPELAVRPGPRLVEGLERLARELHPEAFSP
jgi:iron complex transport system substrate-binding protein